MLRTVCVCVYVDEPSESVPAELTPRSPGAQSFGSLLPSAPLTWLTLPPTAEDLWTDDAISVLMDVWSSHLDAELQQWMNKHGNGVQCYYQPAGMQPYVG